jgi:dolichyl-diphosphooligosaccharide--protein glycosyltransferase
VSATGRALGKVKDSLGKYINREVLAERVQDTRKSFSEVSRGTVIEVIALALIMIVAFAVRWIPIRWGFYLNEFDPYLQWRMAQYVVDHGFLAWFSWHDTLSWYPYGADMSTWNLYGVAFVVAAITMFLHAVGTSVSVFDVAVIFPPVAGTLTVLATYFLGKDIWGKGVGMFTALFMALNSSSIGRTQLGFLRHEPLGILLMILIFLFFRRASAEKSTTNRTIAYATLAGVCLYFLAASWAGDLYPLDLLVLYAVIVGVLGRSSKKFFLSYSICMGIFLLLTPFLVPKLGFASLKDLTWLAIPAGEVVLLAREASNYLANRRSQILTLVGGIVVTGAVVVLLSYFNIISNPAGKFYAVINPLVRGSTPIIQSVAEHQPATWGSFFYEFGTIIFLTLFGFVFMFQRARNDDIFVILWGVTSVYFAASFVRLTLLMAPAFCILAGIGTVELGKPAVDIIREAVIYPRRKTHVIARIGREFGVAIFLILLIVIAPTFWTAVQASYQPATIVTSSIPAVPAAGSELKYTDWLQALSWMRENTPPSSVIFAWWDYGYWITALGDRRSITDNGTQNSTQIAIVAQTFLSNATFAMPTLKRYNVSYVAIFVTPSGSSSSSTGKWQGYGEDGKWYWMARIGNNTVWNNYRVVFTESTNAQAQTSTYNRLIMNGTKVLANETIADTTNGPSDNTLLGYMMAQVSNQAGGTTGTQTTTPTFPEVTQVFSSTNNFVFLFKVSYLTSTVVTFRPIQRSITYGQKVLVAGNLTDSRGNLLTVSPVIDIEYTTDSGVTWNRVDEIPVNADGSFNYTWIPNAGNYTVRVHYPGYTGVYLDAVSVQQPLTVNKANVTLGIAASTTSPGLGQNVTLNWQMSPFAPAANVTLSYTTDNKTLVKITSVIMTSSSMNYSWKDTVAGTFRIVVTVAEDSNFNPAVASIQMKTV